MLYATTKINLEFQVVQIAVPKHSKNKAPRLPSVLANNSKQPTRLPESAARERPTSTPTSRSDAGGGQNGSLIWTSGVHKSQPAPRSLLPPPPHRTVYRAVDANVRRSGF